MNKKQKKRELRRQRKQERKLDAKRKREQKYPAKNEAQQPPPAEPEQESQDKQINANPPKQPASKDDSGQQPRRADWSVRVNIICAVVEAACAIAIAYFAWGQVWFGSLQWDATEKQYKAMLAQNKIAQDQLVQTAKSLSQTEKQIELMQIDQRPWIEIELPKFTSSPTFELANKTFLPDGTEGQYWECTFVIKNIGKTPAFLKNIKYLGGVEYNLAKLESRIRDEFVKRGEADEMNLFIPPNSEQAITELFFGPTQVPAGGITLSYPGAIFAAKVLYAEASGTRHGIERWFSAGMKDRVFSHDDKNDKMY